MAEQDGSFQFTVTPSVEDWIAANWLIVRQRWLWRKLLIGYLAISLFYAVLFIAVDIVDYGWHQEWVFQRIVEAAQYAAILVAILIALTFFMLPRRVRKQFADTARLADCIDLTIGPEGITSRTAIGSISLRWDQLLGMLENMQVMALMITEREMILLPKSQVDSEALETVRRYIEKQA